MDSLRYTSSNDRNSTLCGITFLVYPGFCLKAERKRLAPFFAADERFIQTDVCELVSVEFQPEETWPS